MSSLESSPESDLERIQSAGPLEEDAWETAPHKVYDAIRGANNWLVALRNATDEAYDPWSDYFTSQERTWVQGLDDESPDWTYKYEEDKPPETHIVSYSEGLTAVWLTAPFASANNPQRWDLLQSEYYIRDIQQLLDWILGDEWRDEGWDRSPGSGESAEYSPLPYLPPVTEDFTDAVSFSTTALLGALSIDQYDVEAGGGEANMERAIHAALETNANWFIHQAVEAEEGLGWSYVGSRDGPDGGPERYFTYSASIAIVDLIREHRADSEFSLDDETVEEMKGLLQDAKEYLLSGEPTDEWVDTGPSVKERNIGYSYTIIATSYIDRHIDDVNITDSEMDKLSRALNKLYVAASLDSTVGLEDQLDGQIFEYKLFENKDNGPFIYYDGSAPYLYVEVLIEYINLVDVNENGKYPDNPNKETLREQQHELAGLIVDILWNGGSEYVHKGFMHPDSNIDRPTVLYTTQTAIDTLLKYLGSPRDTENDVIKSLRPESEKGELSSEELEKLDEYDDLMNKLEDVGEERDSLEHKVESLRDRTGQSGAPQSGLIYIDEANHDKDETVQEVLERVNDIKETAEEIAEEEKTDDEQNISDHVLRRVGELETKDESPDFGHAEIGNLAQKGEKAAEAIEQRLSDKSQIDENPNEMVCEDGEIGTKHGTTYTSILMTLFYWDSPDEVPDERRRMIQDDWREEYDKPRAYLDHKGTGRKFYPFWSQKLEQLADLPDEVLNDDETARQVAIAELFKDFKKGVDDLSESVQRDDNRAREMIEKITEMYGDDE